MNLGRDKVYFQAERHTGAGTESWTHLEDAGYVEKVTVGDSFRYRVLEFCACKGGNPQSGFPALRREPIFSAQRLMGEPSVYGFPVESMSVGGSGVKSESVQKSDTTGYLAKVIFPRVVRDAGIEIMPQSNFAALIHHLNRLKLQGVDIETMELMIEEFGHHPEWCRRSRKPPWQVFVGRVEELGSLVAYRKRKDPVRRRWNGGTGFFSGHTPRAISPA